MPTFHPDRPTDDGAAAGMSRRDAERREFAGFGNVPALEVTDVRGRWFEDLGRDVRYAFRTLRRSRGFTVVAVLTLALGIGASTAIFSVVNALLVRQLPFPHPERLVWVEEVSKQGSQEPWGGHFLEWRDQSQTLEGIAAYDYATRTLMTEGGPERVDVALISGGFLPLLGVQPLAPGRELSAAEDRPGGERVALLSYAAWQRHFRGEPQIVGRAITLDDADYRVIGVLPESFHFFQPFDVWVPLGLDPQAQLAGQTRYFGPTIARLKSGVTMERARSELDAILQRYETTRPEGSGRIDSRTRLVPLREHLLGDTRRPLLVLSGAVALLLLIACANVANLLLARALTRQQELAIRAALGASRRRLMRQVLTECVILALAGGAAGVLLAGVLTDYLGSFDLSNVLGEMARVAPIAMDVRVFAFVLLTSLVIGVLFGLLPTLQVSRPAAEVSFRSVDRGSRSHATGLRSVLIVSEIALAIVLLVGAGLLVRSFVRLLEVDPGYRADNLLTARLQLPPADSGNTHPAQFYDRLLERVAAIPGADAVGATSHLPLVRYNMGGTLRVEGREPEEGEREPAAPIAAVSPGYFHTMGIGLRAGRLFDDRDAEGAPRVVLLSDALARTLFPDTSPLGRRLFVAGEWATIVGVVADVRHQGLAQDIEPAVYFSYRQLPRPTMAVVVRSSVAPSQLASSLRAAMHDIDPSLPLFDVMTMQARLSRSIAGRRFNLLLLASFAVVAVLLAAVGIYGVIAYIVTDRSREIGIRMALGAQRQDVSRMVLGHGMRLASLGVALGLTAALGLSRSLQTLLFDVTPSDPLTFALIPVFVAGVALLACWLPARRAAGIDPLTAIRDA
jgi:putative ABC transport system permease protein